ncbi:phosphopantetheine-binding protein [Eubacterium xylanophilum]|uniref:phosphopantetheine-binding protein n=1 Tax=Eubacterium xylanophilum TaxID=39497 RepID=UPI00047B2747|nr:phosphopantetheine-binding protein [Eubacterium xylanophilum]
MSEDIICKIIELYEEGNHEIDIDKKTCMDMDMYDDLDFDSIDALNLLTYIEEEYDISYEKLAFAITNYSNIGEFIDYCDNL